MSKFVSGYVSITGKPNVGKSTLMNAIFKRKVSIVSYKPQTTRNMIKNLYNDVNSSIMFLDTPGYHDPNNKLDTFLNSEIKASYKISNCALLLIDPTRDIDEEDKTVIKFLIDYNMENVILVITKNDLSSEKKNTKIIEQINSLIKVVDNITISSKNENDVNNLLSLIKKYIPVGKPLLEPTDDKDDFNVSEIIREQIIFNTKQELPYSTNVYVENKKYENNLLTINAVIVVEKESQKPIVIGAGGSMIKKIGTNARLELLNIYDCKINLKLFVKVEKD
jgi:GTP-binding protein Era